jgi:hypothetical protein
LVNNYAPEQDTDKDRSQDMARSLGVEEFMTGLREGTLREPIVLTGCGRETAEGNS